MQAMEGPARGEGQPDPGLPGRSVSAVLEPGS